MNVIKKEDTGLVIGIPKALFYFQHNLLWESFFKNLGCRVILSEDTNIEIMNNGIKLCGNENCLPIKIFHGHVHYLADKADIIFIPRYMSLNKNEYTCPQFCGIPDIAPLNIGKDIRVIEVRLHLDKAVNITVDSLKDIAFHLNIDIKEVATAFIKALDTHNASIKKDEKAIHGSSSSEEGYSHNIVVLGHPYMIYDRYLSMNLIKKLNDRKIRVLTSKNLDYNTKRENAFPFQDKVFWEIGLDNLGSCFAYTKNKSISGMIYLTPFACGLDSLIIEFIERRIKKESTMPFLKLTVDEHSGEAGFDTRLEAFLDMIS